MTKMMKAALMTSRNQPLEIHEVPVPEPGPGEVLVKIDVCGLCHTDLHYWKGDHELPRALPVVLGHEGIGTVVTLGRGVTGVSKGDRVGTGFVHGTCGRCRECLTGYETLCSNVRATSVDVDGCFAEYAILKADWATPIPDSMEAAQAAPLLCAGVAAYSAVRKAKLEPGELAVVFGTGGLGSYAIQIAKDHGANVAAVDVSDEKLAYALEIGADWAIAANDDPAAKIQSMGGADACFNFAPVSACWRQMLDAAGARARLILISLPKAPLSFAASEIIERGIQVIGSADGTRQELRQLMELARTKKVSSVIETTPFAEINSAFEQLAAGEVQGRLVVDLRS